MFFSPKKKTAVRLRYLGGGSSFFAYFTMHVSFVLKIKRDYLVTYVCMYCT